MSNIIWSPQPRQAAAMACLFDEVFFGGARGGGKTDWVVEWQERMNKAKDINDAKTLPVITIEEFK